MNYKNLYKLFSFKELIIIKNMQSNINIIINGNSNYSRKSSDVY